ncbi:MAG: hypothetical protein WCG47_08690 [Dermatophilaceae bacterium]
MGQLVYEGVWARATCAEHNVAARGVRTGADLRGGALRSGPGVDAYIGEVGAEAGLHLVAQRRGQQLTGAT